MEMNKNYNPTLEKFLRNYEDELKWREPDEFSEVFGSYMEKINSFLQDSMDINGVNIGDIFIYSNFDENDPYIGIYIVTGINLYPEDDYGIDMRLFIREFDFIGMNSYTEEYGIKKTDNDLIEFLFSKHELTFLFSPQCPEKNINTHKTLDNFINSIKDYLNRINELQEFEVKNSTDGHRYEYVIEKIRLLKLDLIKFIQLLKEYK